jgi:hypothetical protein
MTDQYSLPHNSYPPGAKILSQCTRQCNCISGRILSLEKSQALIVRARQSFSGRAPLLKYTNRSKYIVLGASKLLCVVMTAWVDWVAPFVVELYVVVRGGFVVS